MPAYGPPCARLTKLYRSNAFFLLRARRLHVSIAVRLKGSWEEEGAAGAEPAAVFQERLARGEAPAWGRSDAATRGSTRRWWMTSASGGRSRRSRSSSASSPYFSRSAWL